jgi:hypothetical protein
MVLSQHPMDHARKRARGTNAKFGLGPRVRSVYLSRSGFFHGVSRVRPRNLLGMTD